MFSVLDSRMWAGNILLDVILSDVFKFTDDINVVREMSDDDDDDDDVN